MTKFVAVDIGNTAIKLGQFSIGPKASVPAPTRVWDFRFESGQWLSRLADSTEPSGTHAPLTETTGWNEMVAALGTEPTIWFVSSVHRARERQLAGWLADTRPVDRYRRLTHCDVPLAMEVDFPERVGFDRLATAVAADRLRPPAVPAIVVDAGTALKVHAVTAQGTFVGGAILPGYHLAGRALAVETDLLPQIGVSSRDPAPVALGRNTEAAIRSGLYWGFVGAARELVARISGELEGDPIVFVSGGDAKGLVPYLGNAARYVSDMCLVGIAVLAQPMLQQRSGSRNEAIE